MPSNYIPIVIFILLAFAFPTVTLLAAKLIRPDAPYKEKLTPYECGVEPVSNSRGRYAVRFYIIAILFVIFGVETIFLFPWAVQYTGWIPKFKFFGMVEMGVFLGILLVGYIWVYKKGALEWI